MRKLIISAYDFFAAGGGRLVSTYAAAGAYFLFISLVPLTMLLCSLLQFTPLTEAAVLAAAEDYLPASLMTVVRRIVGGVYESGAGTVTLSAVLTVWSASASMKALMRGLDSVYVLERRENYILFSLRAVGNMLIFVLMLLLSFFAMVYGGRILDVLRSYTVSGSAADNIIYAIGQLRFPAIPAVLALMFALMYSRVPARGQRTRRVFPGALFSAAAWTLFSWLFSLYVQRSDKFGAYGFLGSILLSLTWMYFCFYFLLLGGCLNVLTDNGK